MPNSHAWSNTSAPCRLEWRPSRWLQAALVLLTVGAGLSVWGSDLPMPLAWPACAGIVVHGLHLLRRERGRAAIGVVVGEDAVTVDGVVAPAARFHWRGPLVFLHWREGAGRRALVWWPDTLDRGTRRELRLAAPAPGPAHHAGSMAT